MYSFHKCAHILLKSMQKCEFKSELSDDIPFSTLFNTKSTMTTWQHSKLITKSPAIVYVKVLILSLN